MTPLAGIYDLRLGDAHTTSDKVFDAYKLVRIDDKQLFICQGYQLIQSAACSLNTVVQIIQNFLEKQTS